MNKGNLSQTKKEEKVALAWSNKIDNFLFHSVMEKATTQMILLKMEKELRDRLDEKIDSDTNAAVYLQEPEREIPDSSGETMEEDACHSNIQRAEDKLQDRLLIIDELKHIVRKQQETIHNLQQKRQDYHTCVERSQGRKTAAICRTYSPKDFSDEESLEFHQKLDDEEETSYGDLDEQAATLEHDSVSPMMLISDNEKEYDDASEFNGDMGGHDIQDAVNSIREEASKVDTVMALERIDTLKCELKSMRKKLRQRSSETGLLRSQLRVRDDHLATLELERDLLKADATKVNDDLHTCIQHLRSFDFSTTENSIKSSSKSVCLDPTLPAMTSTCFHNDYASRPKERPTSRKGEGNSGKNFQSEHAVSRRLELEFLLPKREKVPAIVQRKPSRRRTDIETKRRSRPTGSEKFEKSVLFVANKKALSGEANHIMQPAKTAIAGCRTISSVSHDRFVPKSCHRVSTELATGDQQLTFPESRIQRSAGDGVASIDEFVPLCVSPTTQHEHARASKILRLAAVSQTSPMSTGLRQMHQQHVMAYALPNVRKKVSDKFPGKERRSSANNDKSLQAQVGELSERLRLSVEGTESLRKRLTMVSRYYENIIQKLQENLVETKSARHKMEEELMNQISILEHEKKTATANFELLLRDKDREIRNLKDNKQKQLSS